MGAFGKFLLGSAVVGAVAAGVYYYLDKNDKEKEKAAEEEGKASHANGTDKVLDAASRAYTTIRHGTDEAISNVKNAVGPKGSEVMDVVGDAAVKVKDVVADSAVKVKDIVTSKEDGYVTAPKAAPEEEEAIDIPVKGGEETEEAAEEKAEEEPAAEPKEETEDLKEDPETAKKADEVEEFFDDDPKE